MHDLAQALDEHPDPPSALQLVQAEVAGETVEAPDGLPDGAVLVPIGDTEVAVLSDQDWPSSANEDMAMGLYGRWAQKALATEADIIAWFDLDPTNRQVADFLVEWAKRTGRDPKDAQRPRNGSGRGRRR